MASATTATLTFRLETDGKEAVCIVAGTGHRSIANTIAMMICACCGQWGVEIAEPVTTSNKQGRK